MAKRGRNHRNGKRKLIIPMGVVLGFAPGITSTFAQAQNNEPAMSADGWLNHLIRIYTGYSREGGDKYLGGKHWSTLWFRWGLYPLLAGMAAHYVAGKIGINRALGRAGVPLIRI